MLGFLATLRRFTRLLFDLTKLSQLTARSFPLRPVPQPTGHRSIGSFLLHHVPGVSSLGSSPTLSKYPRIVSQPLRTPTRRTVSSSSFIVSSLGTLNASSGRRRGPSRLALQSIFQLNLGRNLRMSLESLPPHSHQQKFLPGSMSPPGSYAPISVTTFHH